MATIEESERAPTLIDGEEPLGIDNSELPGCTKDGENDEEDADYEIGTPDTVIDYETTKHMFDDDDEYYDTDLEIEDIDQSYQYHNLSSAKIYIETCKIYNVVAASYFERHLLSGSETIRMRHHGLGPLGARALAVPLVSNISITQLDLEDNWVEGEGAEYLSEMLKENFYISTLSLANNQLGRRGARAMSDMLQWNSCLTNVDLSSNNFTDNEAYILALAISSNQCVRDLNLSRNCLANCGAILGHAIGENEAIENLDLSWNNFRSKSAMALLDGIMSSTHLKSVNLSWNGLGNEGAFALCKCLQVNTVLTSIDVSSNRFNIDAMMSICKGMKANETLKVFKIGNNNIKGDGALLLLHSMNNERNNMMELYLDNIIVSEEFHKMYKGMVDRGRSRLMVTIGGLTTDPAIRCFPSNALMNPVKVLKEHLLKTDTALTDLFPLLAPDKPVFMDEFLGSIETCKVPLNSGQISSLMVQMGIVGNERFKFSAFQKVIDHQDKA